MAHKRSATALYAGINYTTYWGWYTTLLTLTHTPKLRSSLGVCVYCSSGVFVHSVGF